MIEYEQKNKKFSLNLEKENIFIETKSKIMNLSICQDMSSVIISTEKNSCMIISFQDLLRFPEKLKSTKENQKLENKVNDFILQVKRYKQSNLLSQLILEMNPSKEDGLSIAICLGKRINTVQILKNKSIEVKHGENSKCKFIQWENEFLICAFENRVIKIIKNYYPMKSFTDEEIITAMKIVHWQEFNLLVIGNNKKVKILYFYSILDNEYQTFVISKLEGKIDIIEPKNQYILFCSKEYKKIYCFQFMNNNWKPKMLFEINLFNFVDLEPEQEILNVKLISYEGIIVSFKNKICLFYIKDNKIELNSIIREPQENISFSSLIYNRNQYYLIYSLQDKIKIIEINMIQSDSSNSIFPLVSDLETRKNIINICINTLINRKGDFTMKKLDDYSIQIKTELALIKLEFNLNDLSLNFSVLKYFDEILKKNIEEEIQKMKLNEDEKIIDNNDYIKYVTEKIIFVNKLITSDFSESISEGESEIDKLKKEQFLFYYETFKNWQEIMKQKIPIKNLYNDEDEYEFDLDNKIMAEPIKNLVPEWNLNFENLNIDNAFNFANSNFYSSNNSNKIEEKNNNKLTNVKENTDTAVIYKLNKESFEIYLDKINEKRKIENENILILGDILSQIKYYFQEIINQNSINLIQLYRESILDILLTLESGLDFVFLFICIIPISELIWNEINKRSNLTLNKSPIKDLRYQNNSDYNFNKMLIKKNSSKISWSSENDDNDIINENEDKEDYFLEYEIDDLKGGDKQTTINNNEYIKEINNNDNNSDLGKNNNIYKKRFSFTKKNNKDDAVFIRTNKKYLTNRFYKNKNINLSFSSNKHEKNLVESLTSSFCNSIIDYVIFFSEELNLLNKDSPDERLIGFFYLANIFYKIKDISTEISEIKKQL